MKKLPLFLYMPVFILLMIACHSKDQALADNDLVSINTNSPEPYAMRGTQVIPINDSQSGGQYQLYVKLPEAYAENDSARYPVIYFTDADWHIETLSAATEYIMENTILVGISWQKDIDEDLMKEEGVHVSRYRDYTVEELANPEQQAKYQCGQAGNHLEFIRNDVFKYVEDNYRTTPENRTYFGYSLGGLFGAYILLAQPESFKNYILGSPAFGGDIPYLTSLVSDARPANKNLNANVYISYGSSEDELGGHAEEFITLLKNRNDHTLSLQHPVLEGSHQTAFPTTGIQGVAWLSKLIGD